jgi:IS5 family transposase
MSTEARAAYKIRNWAKYNEALVNRGDITFWFSDEIIEQWKHDNLEQGQGHPFVFSDLAIETLLTMREMFRFPYRGTEGFGRWVFRLMKLDLAIPDYTSLCKRAKKLDIDLSIRKTKGKIDIVVDSTGLKVFGEGEWKTRTHGKSKRRTWRKLHLAIDPLTQEIVADVLTDNSVHDSEPVAPMLKQVRNKVRKFYGDGAYDPWKVRNELENRGIEQVIPPRRDAKIKRHGNSKQPRLERDEAIRNIRKYGRKGWKQRIGYHRRSLAETAMFRMKTCFGAHLKNRFLPNQKTEAKIRCKILNHFTKLGMPEYFSKNQ